MLRGYLRLVVLLDRRGCFVFVVSAVFTVELFQVVELWSMNVVVLDCYVGDLEGVAVATVYVMFDHGREHFDGSTVIFDSHCASQAPQLRPGDRVIDGNDSGFKLRGHPRRVALGDKCHVACSVQRVGINGIPVQSQVCYRWKVQREEEALSTGVSVKERMDHRQIRPVFGEDLRGLVSIIDRRNDVLDVIEDGGDGLGELLDEKMRHAERECLFGAE